MSVTDEVRGGHVVIEAVKTTASAGELWAIVIVAVATLAFWLSTVAWADLHPNVRRRQVPDMPGPVLGGMHVATGGRSVAPNREAPPVFGADAETGAETGEPDMAATAPKQGGPLLAAAAAEGSPGGGDRPRV